MTAFRSYFPYFFAITLLPFAHAGQVTTGPTFAGSTLTAPVVPLATGAYAVASGDFNRDGTPDIAVANYSSGNVTIWIGNGLGGFTQATGSPLTASAQPAALAVADINGDGKLDLVIAYFSSAANNVDVRLGNGDGTFGAAQLFTAGSGPVSIAVGDFNRDGKPDLAIANTVSNNVSIFLNTTALGSSTVAFAAASNFAAGTGPAAVAIGDFNGDGFQDLAITDQVSNNSLTVLIGNGGGSFSPASYSPTGGANLPIGVAVGDFNGDGFADIAIASFGNDKLIVLLGSGAGFSPMTGGPFNTGHEPFGLAVGDFNGDGQLDIAVSNYGSANLSVFLGGGGTMTAAAGNPFPVGTNPQSIISGDFNLDGEPDLAIPNFGTSNVTLLLNSSPAITANPASVTLWAGAEGQGAISTVAVAGGGAGYHVGDILTAFGGGGSGAVFRVTGVNGSGLVQSLAVVTTGSGYSSSPSIVGGNGVGLSINVGILNNGAVPSPPGVGVRVNSTVSGSSYGVTSDQNWVAPSPTSNATGGPSTVTLPPNQNNLPAGRFAANVRYNSPNFFGAKTSATLNVANPSGTLVHGSQLGLSLGLTSDAPQIATGDFNLDGKPDLVVATSVHGSTVIVLPGNGAGGFSAGTAFAAGAAPFAVAVGDFNGDGKPDLAVANDTASGTVTVLLGDGTGNFTPAFGSPFAVGGRPQSVAVGDFNGDGKPDLAVANFVTGTVTVLLGNGFGGFAPAPGSPINVGEPNFVVVGDFNGDGKPDLAVSSLSGFVAVLLGNGMGGFAPAVSSPLAAGGSPKVVVTADFNGDGKLDIAVTNNDDGTVNVWLGDGSGSFSSVTGSPFQVGGSPFGMAVGDFDGDGKPDLAVSTYSATSVSILLGDGTGNFTLVPGNPFGTQADGTSIAVGDFDGDGRTDLAMVGAFGNTGDVLLGARTFTATNVMASVNSAVPYGTPVTFTAAVNQSPAGFGSAATGAVIFNATGLGPHTVLASPYTLTTTSLVPGSYNVQAVYQGDARGASSSGSVGVTVTKANEAITFGALSDVNFGDAPFLVSATVAVNPPSTASPLSLTFVSNTLGVCTVNVLTNVVTIVGVGQCSISAVESGNSNLNGAIVTRLFNVHSGDGADTGTQGNWKGVYGADGEAIIGDSTNYPAYVQVNFSGATPFVWATSTSDARDLQTVAGSGRIASGWYAGSNMSIDLNFTDGSTHQVAIYFLDWDNQGRAEQVQVLDALSQTVLDTRSVTGFQNGQYVVMDLRGHVTLKITLTGGPNAVVNGIFFGPAALAAFVTTDTTAQGSWKGAYGTNGDSIVGDAANLPSYVQLVPGGGANAFFWTTSNSDVRDLQEVSGSTRIASGWYAGSAMSFDLNLTDQQVHRVAVYFLDWDNQGRTEQVQIVDAVTQTVLDTRTISGFQNGKYLVWDLSGHVTLKITLTGGPNAVVNGIFFGPPTSAAFVTTDTAAQGSWKGIYGTNGDSIVGDTANLPSYVQFVPGGGANAFVWTTSNSDTRDLQEVSGSTRIASGWYADSAMSFDLNLTDQQVHRVAVYFLDWDNQSRTEQVQIVDAVSQTVLDTRTVSGFQNGKYLVWDLSGHVTLKITLTGGANAVVNGIFFGPPMAAAFVTTDTTTQGSWKGTYGTNGDSIVGDAANLPSYVQFVPGGGANAFVWTTSNSDMRDLQELSGSTRIASGWYTGSAMGFDLNLTDRKVHRVAAYFLDWDNQNRTEQVQIVDAVSQTVLDTRTVSGFQNGKYLVWDLSGHVTLKITAMAGPNGVVSGFFFGPSPAASYITLDTLTQGSWKGVYGTDGEAISGDSSVNPAYAQVNFAGATPFIWASSGSDVRDLQKAAPSDRIASAWYTTSSMSIDVNLTDGNSHRVALYFLDWDNAGRAERVDVIDSVTQTVLDTRTVSGFAAGQYLVWTLSGHVKFRITLTSGPNAVVSGLFFGLTPSSASFVTADMGTQGTWKGTYGVDGEVIDADATSAPAYAQVALGGNSVYTWLSSTSDVRALQKAASSDRIASTWYTSSNMTIDINLTDGNTHPVALYMLDWDTSSRAERVDVVDASSQVVLDTRTVSGFHNGEYLVWNLHGHVTLRITLTGGANAVASGLFFH